MWPQGALSCAIPGCSWRSEMRGQLGIVQKWKEGQIKLCRDAERGECACTSVCVCVCTRGHSNHDSATTCMPGTSHIACHLILTTALGKNITYPHS